MLRHIVDRSPEPASSADCCHAGRYARAMDVILIQQCDKSYSIRIPWVRRCHLDSLFCRRVLRSLNCILHVVAGCKNLECWLCDAMYNPSEVGGQLRPLLPATSRPQEQLPCPKQMKKPKISACQQCRVHKSKVRSLGTLHNIHC
jgi:hypothetical protein